MLKPDLKESSYVRGAFVFDEEIDVGGAVKEGDFYNRDLFL